MVTLYTRVLYLLTNILSVVAKKKAVIIFMVPITEHITKEAMISLRDIGMCISEFVHISVLFSE
jgi:hypothetical protein